MKKLSDYTEEQKQKFDNIHRTLRHYNERLSKGEDPALPGYSEKEMSDYSIYRQLLIQEKVDKAKL
jgi:hypothetical protein